jgi:hypothetical protein
MLDADRLDYLAGQVHALLTFACAAIEAHPDPLLLRRKFERLQEIALSKTEPARVKEVYLDGQRETHESLAVYLAKAT